MQNDKRSLGCKLCDNILLYVKLILDVCCNMMKKY